MASLKITQVKSAIGRKPAQRSTIKALGLKRLNQSVLRPDNPQTRGMVARVSHLVEVEEVK